jgi:hypothetical protein
MAKSSTELGAAAGVGASEERNSRKLGNYVCVYVPSYFPHILPGQATRI